MRRLIPVSVVAVLMAVVASSFQPALAASDRARIEGVILRVGDDGFVMRARNDHRVRVRVTRHTHIVKNGEAAELGDLDGGDRVAVTGVFRRTPNGRVLVARHVRAASH